MQGPGDRHNEPRVDSQLMLSRVGFPRPLRVRAGQA